MEYLEVFLSGCKRGFFIGFRLLKIIVPFYIGFGLIKDTYIFTYISNLLSPFMHLFGLPGSAASIIVVGNFITIYGACGMAATLSLSWKQITILGVMIGISHQIIVEGFVLREAGTNYIPITLVRVIVSFFGGYIFNLIW